MLTMLLIKNEVRRILHYIKEKKLYCFFYLCIAAFFAYWLIATGIIVMMDYVDYFTTGVCIYEVLKIIQKMPTLKIPVQLIQYKCISQQKYKLYVFLKCIGTSLIIYLLYVVIGFMIDLSIMNHMIILICTLNLMVNLNGFIKSQVLHAELVTAITVIEILIALLFNSTIIIGGMTILSLVFFTFQKQVRLDRLFPFYLFMSNMGRGIANKNYEKIAETQKSMEYPRRNLLIKYLVSHYGDNFGRYKEIKRILNNYTAVINTIILNSCLSFAAIVLLEADWLQNFIMVIAFFISENILSILNKQESQIMRAGVYLPFSLKDWFQQKYWIQAALITIVLLPTLGIVNSIGILPYLICLLIIPAKNIFQYFSPQDIKAKILRFLLDFIICSLCFLEFVI